MYRWCVCVSPLLVSVDWCVPQPVLQSRVWGVAGGVEGSRHLEQLELSKQLKVLQWGRGNSVHAHTHMHAHTHLPSLVKINHVPFN